MWREAAVGLAVLWVVVGGVRADDKTATPAVELTLREPLDRDWAGQWVSWPIELPKGKFHQHEMVVRRQDGSRISHHIIVNETHPDGTASQATVWVYTGLDAGQTKRFQLCQVGPISTAMVPTGKGPIGSGYNNGSVETSIWTGSETFEPPARIEDVPPPIRSVRRNVPHSARVHTRLVELPAVRKVASLVEQSGPRLSHEMRYEFADGSRYVFRHTMIQKEQVLLIEEDFRTLSVGGLVVDFTRAAGLTHGHGRGRLHPPGKGKLEEGYEIDFSRAWTGRIQPYYAWWHDYGLWWAAYQPGGEYVGILPLNPPAWTNPPPNPIQIRTGGDRKVEAFLPFRNGTRKWALVLARADEALQTSEGGANLMMRTAIRLGQNPLDKVKDMVLTWPGMDQIENPRLLCTKADIPAIRTKARTHPLFKRVLEKYPEKPNDPAGLYLATGDEKYARQAIDALTKQLRGRVTEALDGRNYGEALNAIGFTRPLRRAALIYDLVAASESMTPAQRNYFLRTFAFLAYCLADENRWPARDQGFSRGNVNFHSDDYTCRAAVVALLAGHPKQTEWMDYVEREMRSEFASSVFPGGAWCEAPNYQGYTMHYLIIAMRIMQLNGFADFAKDPRFRATMDYFFRIQTPFDVRAGRHLLPTVGDTTSYHHSQSLQNVFAWAAALFVEDDRALAGRMMHAWKRGGSIVFGAHGLNAGAGWTQPLTLLDPDIPEVPPAEPLHSERLPGYGALLRNNYGTDRESYFLFKMGQADQHYDSDEGSFHWYALGMPLSLDFGSMYYPCIEQPWLHSTLDFDRQRIWTRGEVTAFASLPGVDFCEGELAVNDVQRVPELPGQELPEGVSGEIERGQRFVDWRRQILFVKGPDYVVIRDDLDDVQDEIPTGWSLQVLALDVDVAGSRATCTGQHGVDLDVLVVEPAGARLTTSKWGHAGKPAPPWLEPEPMPAMGETQIALHTTAPPDGDYLVAMFPYRHGQSKARLTAVGPGVVQTTHGDGCDLIFFAANRGLHKAGDVTFAGRVGLVRRSPDATRLHIIEGISMRVPEMIAQFPGPVTLEIRPGYVRGACAGQTRTCFLHWTDPPPIPARLTIDGQGTYVYATFDGYLSFTVPAGRHSFEVCYNRSPER